MLKKMQDSVEENLTGYPTDVDLSENKENWTPEFTNQKKTLCKDDARRYSLVSSPPLSNLKDEAVHATCSLHSDEETSFEGKAASEKYFSDDEANAQKASFTSKTDEKLCFSELEKKLYPHQKLGVMWLENLFYKHKGGILGDDMGLGKTLQIIAFLSKMFEINKIQLVLVIVPTSLLLNWKKEFKKWAPNVRMKIYHGHSKKNRKNMLDIIWRDGGILLTTYGLLTLNTKELGQDGGVDRDWDYIILDEGHKIKNPTKTKKAAHAIVASHRIILTGTPIQNNLMELWSLYDFVHHGRLLGTKKTFKIMYENPITKAREKNATSDEKQLGYQIANDLKRIISPYFLRRTKEKLLADPMSGLPLLENKQDIIIWGIMTKSQQTVYKLYLELDEIKNLVSSSRSPLVALTVMKKICDHIRLLPPRACASLDLAINEKVPLISENEKSEINQIADETLIEESCKLRILVTLLDQLKSEGHKILVFSQSLKMLDIIQKVLTNRGFKLTRLDGSITSLDQRFKVINWFEKDQSISVLLLTIQVGGVGLTLTAADRLVIVDPSWNPATDNQAVDRIYRIGQEKRVVVYRLITCGTVEEKIYRRQLFKEGINKQATGESDDPFRYFSNQDLRQLFKVEDMACSETQQQLEMMHGSKRLNKTNDHIQQLMSIEGVFGISDHDLVFTTEETVGREQQSDAKIQNMVVRAHHAISSEVNLFQSFKQCASVEDAKKSLKAAAGLDAFDNLSEKMKHLLVRPSTQDLDSTSEMKQPEANQKPTYQRTSQNGFKQNSDSPSDSSPRLNFFEKQYLRVGTSLSDSDSAIASSNSSNRWKSCKAAKPSGGGSSSPGEHYAVSNPATKMKLREKETGSFSPESLSSFHRPFLVENSPHNTSANSPYSVISNSLIDGNIFAISDSEKDYSVDGMSSPDNGSMHITIPDSTPESSRHDQNSPLIRSTDPKGQLDSDDKRKCVCVSSTPIMANGASGTPGILAHVNQEAADGSFLSVISNQATWNECPEVTTSGMQSPPVCDSSKLVSAESSKKNTCFGEIESVRPEEIGNDISSRESDDSEILDVNRRQRLRRRVLSESSDSEVFTEDMLASDMECSGEEQKNEHAVMAKSSFCLTDHAKVSDVHTQESSQLSGSVQLSENVKLNSHVDELEDEASFSSSSDDASDDSNESGDGLLDLDAEGNDEYRDLLLCSLNYSKSKNYEAALECALSALEINRNKKLEIHALKLYKLLDQ